MDKYLEKLNPAELIGETFTHELGDSHTILLADKTDKHLRVFMVDLEDANKDKEHKTALKALKKHLTDDNFMHKLTSYDELKILKYSYAEIRCSLLRFTRFEDLDARFIISRPRNHFDLEGKNYDSHLNIGFVTNFSDNISSIADIKRELSQKNLRNGLRHAIAKHLGELSGDYRKDINDFYYNYLKRQLLRSKQVLKGRIKNIDEQLKELDSHIDENIDSSDLQNKEPDYPSYDDGSSIY